MQKKPLQELQERNSFLCNRPIKLLLLTDGRIASNEYEEIKIYDIAKQNELVMTIPVQDISLFNLYEFDENILICVSHSNNITCWKINKKSYELLFSEKKSDYIHLFPFYDSEHFATISKENLLLTIFESKRPHLESPIEKKVITSVERIKFGVGLKILPFFLIFKENQLEIYSTKTLQIVSIIEYRLFQESHEDPCIQYKETVIFVTQYFPSN